MWPLYEDAWWHDEGGSGTGFGILICIVLLWIWIDGEIKKSKEAIKEKRERERKKAEPAPAPAKQEEPYHFVCGTPFIQARREQERLSANNAAGWKDKTGHILTNEEAELLRKYYDVYMTPFIREMFDDEWTIKNDFEYIASSSVFPKKPYAERDFEVYFYYNMMMPIVQSLIPKHFTSENGFSEKELFDIADDILGEKDHDFNYLSRIYSIHRWGKGDGVAKYDRMDDDDIELPPPY